jgi:MFS family permease
MKDKSKLVTENFEITALTGGLPPLRIPRRMASIFPALEHRNFQLYFFGQSISLIGFWLQVVAMGWVSFQLTDSPFYVGLVATASGLPFLLFAAFAGVFIDKTNKQKLIVYTQVGEAFIAALLGFLVLTGQINILILLTLSFINGIIGAVDLPARQAFVVEMVGKKDLTSASSINVGVFNAARFVGPALAGLLIASFGPGWSFILNSISFIPAISAIVAIRAVYHPETSPDSHPWLSFKEGLNYSFRDRRLSYFMLLGAAAAIFIWPAQTLMPVVAERIFGVGASGLGTLLASMGLGSLVGAIYVSAQNKKENKKQFIFLGLFICSLSLFLFALNRSFVLSHLLLFMAGFGLITYISTVNALVQLLAPDQMRGRVIAVYLTMFVGMMPVGDFLSGYIAQRTSAVFAIGLGAALILALTSFLYLTRSLDHI